ncbi:MAG: leucine-rich repeat domain-containing protein [Treponema sp.]|nr:leucine-rich repeat domain-containing protein [Treponema sp.]MCL2250671.1 leucine-rich repeat domain-containing protein [Treponema sp.]
MGKKNIFILIITVIISVAMWGFGFYKGWIREAITFGYNIYNGLLFGNNPVISTDENVTTIKYGQFSYMLLESIVIPDNITKIEEKAFMGNKLKSITIGSDVLLEKNAIGSGFESNYELFDKSAATFTRSNYKSGNWYIWHDDFNFVKLNDNITIVDFKGTDKAEIPNTIIGYPVVVISDNAFREKNLTSITIPNTVKIIGSNAFRGNNLSSIFIPNSVTNIDINAFADNAIVRVSIGPNVTLGVTADAQTGVLGLATGFNSAYNNNARRAGVYSRPNTQGGNWSITPR